MVLQGESHEKYWNFTTEEHELKHYAVYSGMFHSAVIRVVMRMILHSYTCKYVDPTQFFLYGYEI